MIDYFTDELLATAKKIGKRLRNHSGTTTSNKKAKAGILRQYEDFEVQVCDPLVILTVIIHVPLKLNICEMSATKKGDYKRSSGYVEVEVLKSDSYEETTRKIAECLEFNVEAKECLALFKLNGTRILDKELSINKKKKPWLIGNYMCFLKKSAGQVKLGIGTILKVSEVSFLLYLNGIIFILYWLQPSPVDRQTQLHSQSEFTPESDTVALHTSILSSTKIDCMLFHVHAVYA